MRRRTTRISAWLLSIMLAAGSLYLPAFAADSGSVEDTQIEEAQEQETVETEGQGEASNSSENIPAETAEPQETEKTSGQEEPAVDEETPETVVQDPADETDQQEGEGQTQEEDTDGADSTPESVDSQEATDANSADMTGDDNTETRVLVPEEMLQDAPENSMETGLLSNNGVTEEERTVSGSLTEGDSIVDIARGEYTNYAFTPSKTAVYEIVVSADTRNSSSGWDIDDLILYDSEWNILETDNIDENGSIRYICRQDALEKGKTYYIAIYDYSRTHAKVHIGEYEEPIVEVEPSDALEVEKGEEVTFTAKAGSGVLYRYWWQESTDGKVWKNVQEDRFSEMGAASSLSVAAKGNRYYRCVITDKRGREIKTRVAKLTIKKDQETEPVAVIQGTGKYKTTVAGGQSALYKFVPDAAGEYVISLDYYTGSSTGELELSDDEWNLIDTVGSGDTVTVNAQAGETFYILLNNTDNSENAFRISVRTAADSFSIVHQPESTSVSVGQTAHLSVEVDGQTDELTYIWQFRNPPENSDDYVVDDDHEWETDTETQNPYVETDRIYTTKQYRCVIRDENGRKLISDIVDVNIVLPDPDGDSQLTEDSGRPIEGTKIYTFTPAESGNYRFYLENKSELYRAFLYDQAGTQIYNDYWANAFNTYLQAGQTYSVLLEMSDNNVTDTICVRKVRSITIKSQPADYAAAYGEEVTLSAQYQGDARSAYIYLYDEDGDWIDDYYVDLEDDVEGTVSWTTTATENYSYKFRVYDYADGWTDTSMAHMSVEFNTTEAVPLETGINTVSKSVLYSFTPDKDGTFSFYNHTSSEEDALIYSSVRNTDLELLFSTERWVSGEQLLLSYSLQKGKTYYFTFRRDDEESLQVELKEEKPLKIITQPKSATVAIGDEAAFFVETEGVVGDYTWEYSKDNGNSWIDYSDYDEGDGYINFYPMESGLLRCIVTSYDGETELYTDTVNVTVQNSTIEEVTVGTQMIAASPNRKVYSFRAEDQKKYLFSADAGEKTISMSLYCEGLTGMKPVDSAEEGENGIYAVSTSDYYIEKGDVCLLVVESDTDIQDIHLTVSSLEGSAVAFTKQPTSVNAPIGGEAVFEIGVANPLRQRLHYSWSYYDSSRKSWESLNDADNAVVDENSGRLVISPVDIGMMLRCTIGVGYVDDWKYNEVVSNIVTLNIESTENLRALDEGDNNIDPADGRTFSFTPSRSAKWYFSSEHWMEKLCVYDSDWEIIASSEGYPSFLADLQKDTTYWIKAVPEPNDENFTISINENVPLTIKERPQSVSAKLGEEVSFRALAEGGDVTYRWSLSSSSFGFILSDGDAGEVSIPATSSGEVCCEISNNTGSYKALYADLTVTEPETTIELHMGENEVQQNSSSVVLSYVSDTDTTTSFEIINEGDESGILDFQSELIDSSMNLMDVQSGYSTEGHVCDLREGQKVYLSLYSENENVSFRIVVKEYEEPRITRQPEDVSIKMGDSAEITVEAEGTGLTYTLYKIGEGDYGEWIDQNRSGTFCRSVMTTGEYYIEITDAKGSMIQSNHFTLTIDDSAVRDIELDKEYVHKADSADNIYRFTPDHDGTYMLTGQLVSPTEGYMCADLPVRDARDTYYGSLWLSGYGDAGERMFTMEAGNPYYILINVINSEGEEDSISFGIHEEEKIPLRFIKEPESCTVPFGEAKTITVEAEGTGITYVLEKYEEWTEGEEPYWGEVNRSKTGELTTYEVFEDGLYRVYLRDASEECVYSDSFEITVDTSLTEEIVLDQEYAVPASSGGKLFKFTPEQDGTYIISARLEPKDETYMSGGIGFPADDLAYMWLDGYDASEKAEYSLKAGKTYPVRVYFNSYSQDNDKLLFYFRSADDNTLIITKQPEDAYVREGESVNVRAHIDGLYSEEDLKWYSASQSTGEVKEIGTGESMTFSYEDAQDDLAYYYEVTDSSGLTVKSKTFHVIIKDQAYVNKIAGTLYMSLMLTDKIGMRIHLAADMDKLNGDDYMRFEYNGEVVDQPVSEAVREVRNGINVLTFSIPLTTKQMADNVSFSLFVDGVQGKVRTWSVKKYADRLLSLSTTTEAERAMIKAMLNYGGYAQIFDNYKTDTLANDKVFDAGTDPVMQEDPDLSAYKYELKRATDRQGFNLRTAMLHLSTDISLRFYYVLEDGKTNDDFTFRFEGTTDQPEFGFDDRYNMNYVMINHIAPRDLGKMYTLNVIPKGGTESVTTMKYGPLSYCQQIIGNDRQTKEIQDLCRAIYYYYQATLGLE